MKRYRFVPFLLCILFVAGCSFESPTAKDLSDVLSDMHQEEKEYRTSQKKLNELEASEQLIFSEAMSLTQTEEIELKTTVAELKQILEQRLLLIDDEEASMKQAATFIPNLEKLIEDNQLEMKDSLTQLKGFIVNRYELHETFIKAYRQLSELQSGLYTMFLETDVQYNQLQEQVTEINEQNEVVQKAIDQFNKATEEMNNYKDKVFNSLKIES